MDGWQVAPAGFLAGLVISIITTPVGVSGAVFLLPVQLDILNVPSPQVTPTNLLFNLRARRLSASPDHQQPPSTRVGADHLAATLASRAKSAEPARRSSAPLAMTTNAERSIRTVASG